jgi:histidinol-phosphate aminotransferase
MYKVSAAINNVEMREVQLGEDFSLPVDALLEACDQNTKLMFICSPNNPTGNSFPRKDILRLAEEFEGMLIVDEAYIDFAEAESLKSEIEQYPNIVVLQTMSKAWAMAGLRLGLALADSRVVEIMSQVKYPYNINKAALQIVEQLLEESIDDKVAEIVEQRGVVAEKLATMPFVSKVYPSDANFVLVKVDDADAIYEHLIADGIIVRNRNRVRGCEGCLRITIGTKQENEKLIKSLERYE